MVRKAIEGLYTGRCTVSEYKPVRDEISKITKNKEVAVLKDVPCRLSFKNISSADLNYGNAVTQEVKLFVSPEVDIKDGSKITVTQNGVAVDYTRSGEPAVYSSHKEIVLELFRGWA